MKKVAVISTIALSLLTSSLVGDALSSSLMPTSSKTTKPSVNLDNLNVGAGPVRTMVPVKSRAGSTVIGSVDGHNILKKQADEFLSMVTKGKVTDFDRIPLQQRGEVVKNLASSVLIEQRAKKEVTQEEKNKLAAQYWVSQKIKKVSISDDEAKEFYEKNKKQFKAKDGSQLEFETVKDYVMMNVKQQKFAKELMKEAKVIIK